MRSRLCLIVLWLGLTALVSAATEEHSLGLNLDYLRVHALPEDLPSSPTPRKNALVLDLRFVRANQETATAFSAWLQFQSRPTSPVIVLINPETAPALLTSLASKAPAGVITIGPAVNGLKPDVAIEVTADADREAYEALEHGTSLDELITPKLEKIRHDEAATAKERASGVTGANEPETSEEKASDDFSALETKPKEAKKPEEKPAPPLDAVLQRAVHLHRALLALKKIEA